MGSDEEFLASLGRTLKAERTRRGLTQEELADAVGLSKGYISHVEVARRRPSREALTAIAHALDMTLPDLLAKGAPGHRLSSDLADFTGRAITSGVGPALLSPAGRSLMAAASRRLAELLSDGESPADTPRLPSWVRSEGLSLGLDDAGEILDSAEAARALTEQVADVLPRIAEELGDEVLSVTRLMARLALTYAAGQYRACRREVAVLIVAALTYLTEPRDALPDVVADKGLLDDLGVLVFVAEVAADELAEFEGWLLALEGVEQP